MESSFASTIIWQEVGPCQGYSDLSRILTSDAPDKKEKVKMQMQIQAYCYTFCVQIQDSNLTATY